jgi:hypothetical protein
VQNRVAIGLGVTMAAFVVGSLFYATQTSEDEENDKPEVKDRKIRN